MLPLLFCKTSYLLSVSTDIILGQKERMHLVIPLRPHNPPCKNQTCCHKSILKPPKETLTSNDIVTWGINGQRKLKKRERKCQNCHNILPKTVKMPRQLGFRTCCLETQFRSPCTITTDIDGPPHSCIERSNNNKYRMWSKSRRNCKYNVHMELHN